jgi:predicted nucleic acid-binding protein
MSADSAREFLDTNILVYAYDSSAGDKHRQAVTLLTNLVKQGGAALSIQVLQELFVVLTRKLPKTLSINHAASTIADLTVLPVHTPQSSDVLAAIDLHHRLRLSFWDAMIVRSASQLDCKVIWSEDFADGHRYDGIDVRSPFIVTQR